MNKNYILHKECMNKNYILQKGANNVNDICSHLSMNLSMKSIISRSALPVEIATHNRFMNYKQLSMSNRAQSALNSAINL